MVASNAIYNEQTHSGYFCYKGLVDVAVLLCVVVALAIISEEVQVSDTFWFGKNCTVTKYVFTCTAELLLRWIVLVFTLSSLLLEQIVATEICWAARTAVKKGLLATYTRGGAEVPILHSTSSQATR